MVLLRRETFSGDELPAVEESIDPIGRYYHVPDGGISGNGHGKPDYRVKVRNIGLVPKSEGMGDDRLAVITVDDKSPNSNRPSMVIMVNHDGEGHVTDLNSISVKRYTAGDPSTETSKYDEYIYKPVGERGKASIAQIVHHHHDKIGNSIGVCEKEVDENSTEQVVFLDSPFGNSIDWVKTVNMYMTGKLHLNMSTRAITALDIIDKPLIPAV